MEVNSIPFHFCKEVAQLKLSVGGYAEVGLLAFHFCKEVAQLKPAMPIKNPSTTATFHFCKEVAQLKRKSLYILYLIHHCLSISAKKWPN